MGGQQGGASIGLLLVNSTVATVPDQFNRIIAGAGGAGGAGQDGPSFGLGGGANSGGAGGNGGPSIGIATSNSSSLPSTGFYSYANAPGAPGAGGAAGVDAGQCQGDPGSPGVPGGSAAVYQYPIPTTLAPGESLAGGQSLYSPGIQFQLILQGDSNLCLRSAGNTLWCSQTPGQGIYQAIMQSDGNFVVYEDDTPIWNTNTVGGADAPYRLAMQPDGNLVVYGSSKADVSLSGFGVCSAGTPCIAVWSTGPRGGRSAGTGPYTLRMQDDGNLVMYDSTGLPLWSSGTQR